LHTIKSYFKGRSLKFMCTLCLGGNLVGKKNQTYPIFASTTLKYFSEIIGLRVCGSYLPSWAATRLLHYSVIVPNLCLVNHVTLERWLTCLTPIFPHCLWNAWTSTFFNSPNMCAIVCMIKKTSSSSAWCRRWVSLSLQLYIHLWHKINVNALVTHISSWPWINLPPTNYCPVNWHK
jgi:hypothetical protein